MIKNNINGYKICQKRIGKGSFSTIYKCYDKNNNEFAIKNFNIEKNKDKQLIKNEFNIMRKLSHINILKVFELIIDDDFNNIYIILEYIENGDLSRYLNGSPLNEMYSNDFSIQIKNGLEYLLTNNILHRDIKPQNILVSSNKILKITDFGLSKHINNNQLMETICGSPLYMAPEIIKNKEYTIKSDIWSFGIIIYEMIYGFVPFKSNNIYGLITMIEKKPIFFNSNNISEDCIFLLKSMLKKNPKDRISWYDLFKSKWLNNNILLNLENSLLEIPIDSKKIPNLNNLANYNSNSFKYKRIYNDHDNNEEIDNSLEFNFNLKDSLTLNDSIYLSFSDTESESDTENLKNYSIDKNYNKSFSKKTLSKPINIYGKNNDNKINQNENFSNSFVFVDDNINMNNSNTSDTSDTSDSNKIENSISSSIKGYLNTSINFVKQSCDYINKSSSL